MWWQQQPIRSELSSDTSPASPISEYNPPKQYWQASSIILYEWCYLSEQILWAQTSGLNKASYWPTFCFISSCCFIKYMVDKILRPVHPFSWAGLITAAAGRHILRLPFVSPAIIRSCSQEISTQPDQDIIGAATEQFVVQSPKIKVSTIVLDNSMRGILYCYCCQNKVHI